MSLWGMNDGKTVAGSVTVTAANSTVIGSGTTLTNFAVGDFLHVGKNDYVFTAIANATVATVRAGETGGTLWLVHNQIVHMWFLKNHYTLHMVQ
jgi:hypothetical protein